MKFNYVIYHKHCFDGFASLVVARKSKMVDDKPFIYADSPNTKQAPPRLKGKDVVIMDVSYQPHILKEICKHAKSVTFIDHHTSHIREFNNLKCPNLKLHIDKDHAASILAWRYFFPKKAVPLFLEYIDDNDRGVWEKEGIHEFLAALEIRFKTDTTEENMEKWKELFRKTTVKKLIKDGALYLEYKNYIVFKTTKYTHIHKINFQNKNYKVAVANISGPIFSKVANVLSVTKECDFALVWHYNSTEQKYVVSVRSTKVDVSVIAKKLGGGGHKLAAAFSTKKSIPDMLNKGRLYR